MRQKTGRTADVVRTSHLFNFAGPLRYLWNTQITKLSFQGVGSRLYCFRLPLFHCKTQGCQMFRGLGEKDVHDFLKKRYIATELLQGLRHIPGHFACFLHLFLIDIIVVSFRYFMEYRDDGRDHLLGIEGLGDIPIHARGKTTRSVPFHGMRGHGDDRYVTMSRFLDTREFFL